MTIAAAAVFCGSRHGNAPIYSEAAESLGRGLAEAGIRLVYGGGAVGLMGVVADSTLRAGGSVSGVIPNFLHNREVMHEGVTDLIVTDSMHDRKRLMFAQADAFLILPGGLGTFDEFMEILTWRQLSLHNKPILLVNVGGWGRFIVSALENAVEQGFANSSVLELYDVVEDVPAALERLKLFDVSEEFEETERL
ncbi:LOG family protein [Kozakia baliensis]|uniref:Cytokinin riboside 5'-monophosphate phosphoribohydrolase n=1 Tax=Kozakia baliensis TaxID=153496 RepID=A0A1D8UQ76_9PROT|nr:TIGR00730 family Rossman fold protein [Kozakia baliensis]AOX15794.1 Rossman fold protein, TIGR00730 family [Kozakia baliensis]AOX20890.1 Rossman fold protein, TIGR00730 family [Kozakia baliensis]GBR24152.1 lysine decarboxylase [Kozakia baliensis NRIC 0488]GEL64596.1 cytokinin riboside 5'-monophosphate phosphoribohydrolase [Kozakia baliensis]